MKKRLEFLLEDDEEESMIERALRADDMVTAFRAILQEFQGKKEIERPIFKILDNMDLIHLVVLK